MSTDEERLADLLVESLSSGAYNATAKTVAARLLNKGVTLPPAPEPPCVSKIAEFGWRTDGYKTAPSDAGYYTKHARALHAAGLCSCAGEILHANQKKSIERYQQQIRDADALLRKFVAHTECFKYEGANCSALTDTRTYLEGR